MPGHAKTNLLLSSIILMIASFLTSCTKTDTPATISPKLYIADVNTYLNVRERPSADSQVLGYFLPGDTARVVEIDGEWATVVDSQGNIGYSTIKHLRPIDTQHEPTVTHTDKQYVTEATAALSADDDPATTDTTEPIKPQANPSHTVIVIDSLGVIPESELKNLDILSTILDRTVIVYATADIPVDQIRNFADHTRKMLTKGQYKSIADSLSIFTWIASSSLLECADNTNGADYMTIAWPERYFAAQQTAHTDGIARGAAVMADLLDESEKAFADMNWFMRCNFSKDAFFDAICDGWIASNILTNDTFWHNWFFGWIFKYPLKIATAVYRIFDSLVMTMIFIALLIVSMHLALELYTYSHRRDLEKANFGLAVAIRIFNFVAWLVMISFVVYMFPNMSTLAILEQTGTEVTTINMLDRMFCHEPAGTGWISSLLFIILMVVVGGINRNHIICATMSPEKQRIVYRNQKDDIEKEIMVENAFAEEGQQLVSDKEKLERSDTPYTDLAIDYMTRSIIKTLSTSIVLAMVLNGSLMIFAIIFLLTKLANHIIFISFGIIAFRSCKA